LQLSPEQSCCAWWIGRPCSPGRRGAFVLPLRQP